MHIARDVLTLALVCVLGAGAHAASRKLEGFASAERAQGELGPLPDGKVLRVASLGFDFLFALGEYAAFVTDAAVKAGMDPKRVRTGGDHADLTSQIAAVLEPGDWVLIKGSRAMQMERVVEQLTGGER